MFDKPNRERALFVLAKIDEIPALEQRSRPSVTPDSASLDDTRAKYGQDNSGG